MNNLKIYKETSFKNIKISGNNLIFPSDWEKVRLGDKIIGKTGITPPTKDENNFIGDIKWINISDMKGIYISNKKNLNNNLKSIQNKKLEKGSLLFSFKLSIGKVGFTKYDNMVTNEAIFAYEPSNNNNLNFYYYILPKFVVLNAGTNAYGAKLMNTTLINNAYITIPQTLKEQENIANILTKQDSIISSIEERIKLETQVIKYFTQEELSGRLRLKLTNNSIDELIKYGIIKPINITKTKDDLNNKESISSQTIPLSEINGNEVIKNNKSYDINSIEVVEGQEDELVDYLIGKGNFSNNDNNGFDKKIEFYLNDDWKNVKLNPRKLKIPIDWCVLNTRDYFSFKRGKVISKEYMNNNKGIYPVYSSATLNNGQIGSIDTYTENYNCITWTTDGYAGKLNKRNGKFNVTNICGILKPKKSIDLDFYVSIAQKDVYLMRATTYSNSKVMTSHIEKVKFVSPQTKLEQILISTHLTSRNDIKEELTLELTKQKEVFKYLNQELLSGRLRVK